MNNSFEINVPLIDKNRLLIYLFVLLIIVIGDLIIFNPIKINKTLSKENDLSYTNLKVFKISESGDIIADDDNETEIYEVYKCNNPTCEVLDKNETTNELFIYDDGYLIYNYSTNDINKLNINNNGLNEGKYINNLIYIKDNDKYAVFDVNTNNYLTAYKYDGIYYNDTLNGAYYKTSTYNEVLDVYEDNNIVKTYNHCSRLENNNSKLYCSEHVEGNITNEDVDKELDKVLAQYPDLNDTRFFLIKSGIETVGLPYLWGGGHLSLDNTLQIANTDWNTKQVYLSNGFKNQVAGRSYPSGLDCAGFVRWVYYIASDVDLYKDRVNVISGRNKDVHLINESELIPGDIILDKDHVVIYLYKDENNKPISVHASYDHLQVEISNYKKGNRYYRLNIWN